MKRNLCLALILVFIKCSLFGQYKEVLRNSSVLDMSNAKLSDDVIISLIMYSPVLFNIGDDSLAILRTKGVTNPVIEAMVSAQNLSRIYRIEFTKSDTAVSLLSAFQRPEVYNTDAVEYIASIEREDITIATLNYVTLLTDLIKFGQDEFHTLEGKVAEWDKKVRVQTGEVYRTREQVSITESDLRNMKNSGIDLFGPDLIQTKAKLDIYRGNYSYAKETLKSLGEQIRKWLKTEIDERSVALSRSYASVNQLINQIESDPSFGEQPSEIKISLRTVNESTSEYLVHLTEILVWYQNWIKSVDSLIVEWNPHIRSIIVEDEFLKGELEPIEKRIQQLQLNSRQNRKELSSLKKQVSEIEKSRKELLKRMEGDKKDLALLLKDMSKTYQMSLKQRLNDIIENVDYTFNNRLAL